MGITGKASIYLSVHPSISPELTGPIARSHTFVEIDHKISTDFLFPLIQEGLLSATSESMCMKYWLTA